jgi:acyl carrier protein
MADTLPNNILEEKKYMTENEALIWIAEMFEESVENISVDSRKEDIEGWDSLGVLTLMAAFDEEFDILLSEEELSEFQKVGDILDVLKSHDRIEQEPN